MSTKQIEIKQTKINKLIQNNACCIILSVFFISFIMIMLSVVMIELNSNEYMWNIIAIVFSVISALLCIVIMIKRCCSTYYEIPHNRLDKEDDTYNSNTHCCGDCCSGGIGDCDGDGD